jgi:hypothetical protein
LAFIESVITGLRAEPPEEPDSEGTH